MRVRFFLLVFGALGRKTQRTQTGGLCAVAPAKLASLGVGRASLLFVVFPGAYFAVNGARRALRSKPKWPTKRDIFRLSPLCSARFCSAISLQSTNPPTRRPTGPTPGARGSHRPRTKTRKDPTEARASSEPEARGARKTKSHPPRPAPSPPPPPPHSRARALRPTRTDAPNNRTSRSRGPA